MTTAPVRPGAFLVEEADAQLLGWAVGEAARALRAAGRAVPSELLRLAVILRVSAGGSVASGSAEQLSLSPHGGEVGTTEAASMLGVSRRRVGQLAVSGRLPGRKRDGRWLFPADLVRAYGRSVA